MSVRFKIPVTLMVILLVAFLAPVEPTLSSGQRAPETEGGRTTGGHLDRVDGINILYLYGGAYEMGLAQGRLMRDSIRLLSKKYVERFVGGPEAMIRYGVLSHREMVPHIPGPYMRELEGIADGAGLPLTTVLVMNTYADIKQSYSCSAVCVRPPVSKRPLFGRNLDYHSMGFVEKHSLVIVRRPDGGRPTVAVSWPGSVGIVSGFNERGLTLGMLECFTRTHSVKGMPYAFLYRSCLELETDIPGCRERVESARRTSSNNVLVQEPNGRAGVIETRHDICGFREMDGSGVIYTTNHHRSQDLEQDVNCWRYREFDNFFLADRSGMELADMVALVDRVDLGAMNIQAMVFMPASRELHLATGKIPAAAGPYVQLGPELLFDRCRLKMR